MIPVQRETAQRTHTKFTRDASIVWFRKGLRLHDNPALHAAIKVIKCVSSIVIDPFRKARVCESTGTDSCWNRLRLDDSLRSKNKTGYVLKGKPEDVLLSVMKKWKIDC